MYFNVLDNGVGLPRDASRKAYLLTDNWNDWFKYNTTYSLFVVDDEGENFRIGSVKIGQFEMAEGQSRADIPPQFENLDERFFSVGQDDSYYEALNELEPETRDRILRGLRDMALDQELFERALNEKVTGVSLLRSLTPASVQGQFRRMARGGTRLSSYNFNYTTEKPRRARAER